MAGLLVLLSLVTSTAVASATEPEHGDTTASAPPLPSTTAAGVGASETAGVDADGCHTRAPRGASSAPGGTSIGAVPTDGASSGGSSTGGASTHPPAGAATTGAATTGALPADASSTGAEVVAPTADGPPAAAGAVSPDGPVTTVAATLASTDLTSTAVPSPSGPSPTEGRAEGDTVAVPGDRAVAAGPVVVAAPRETGRAAATPAAVRGARPVDAARAGPPTATDTSPRPAVDDPEPGRVRAAGRSRATKPVGAPPPPADPGSASQGGAAPTDDPASGLGASVTSPGAVAAVHAPTAQPTREAAVSGVRRLAGTGSTVLVLVVVGTWAIGVGGMTVRTVPAPRRIPATVDVLGVVVPSQATLARVLEASAARGSIAVVARDIEALLGPQRGTRPRYHLLVVDTGAMRSAPELACRRLHHRFPDVPLLILHRGEPVRWCAHGATASVPAGSSASLLAAQFGAVTTPAGPAGDGVRFGPFRHVPGRRLVEAAGRPIRCSPAQTAVLVRLLRAGGAVVPHVALTTLAGSPRATTSVTTQVRRLRARLDDVVPGLGAALVTVRGEGVRLDPARARAALGPRADARAGDSQ